MVADPWELAGQAWSGFVIGQSPVEPRRQLFELKVPVVHRASLIRYLVLSPRAGSPVTLGSDVVEVSGIGIAEVSTGGLSHRGSLAAGRSLAWRRACFDRNAESLHCRNWLLIPLDDGVLCDLPEQGLAGQTFTYRRSRPGGSAAHPSPRAVGRAEARGGLGRDAGTPRDAACSRPHRQTRPASPSACDQPPD